MVWRKNAPLACWKLEIWSMRYRFLFRVLQWESSVRILLVNASLLGGGHVLLGVVFVLLSLLMRLVAGAWLLVECLFRLLL